MIVKDLMGKADSLSGRNPWWLRGYKFSPCRRTVFSQTQEIKNVCLKRRFKFVVEKTTNLKPLPFCLERVLLFLRSVFALVRPCFASLEQDRPSLNYASKR